jgi:hypothetical protein
MTDERTAKPRAHHSPHLMPRKDLLASEEREYTETVIDHPHERTGNALSSDDFIESFNDLIDLLRRDAGNAFPDTLH